MMLMTSTVRMSAHSCVLGLRAGHRGKAGVSCTPTSCAVGFVSAAQCLHYCGGAVERSVPGTTDAGALRTCGAHIEACCVVCLVELNRVSSKSVPLPFYLTTCLTRMGFSLLLPFRVFHAAKEINSFAAKSTKHRTERLLVTATRFDMGLHGSRCRSTHVQTPAQNLGGRSTDSRVWPLPLFVLGWSS
jgi:hypothetical protein